MKALKIQSTRVTPRVDFDTNGVLLIEGCSVPKNCKEFFKPILEFVKKLNTSVVELDINLDYFNTSTSKCMLILLKALDSKASFEKVIVNWYSQEDDFDSMEIADLYSECLQRTELNYILHREKKPIAEAELARFDYW